MTLILPLSDDDATARLGTDLAAILRAGDTVLLSGGIGMGKTHLARALIHAHTGERDIPSPTFTLVQTYDGQPEIWHADLYRLSHPDEVIELGLDAAMQEAICLIEWPDRLGDLAPPDALRIALEVEGEGRLARLDGPAPLIARLRARQAEAMLQAAGWAEADREALAGDASARSYKRLRRGDDTAILMDAPPRNGDDAGDFADIARHLLGLGLSAPRIFAEDLPRGFLLLEDLGDDLYTRLLAESPKQEAELYAAATDVLTRLQAAPAPEGLPDLSAQDWAEAAGIAFDWYQRCATGQAGDATAAVAALHRAIVAHADGPRVIILRDYHSPNLLWLPQRKEEARVGLLDFQLAQMGQRGYDLVSLLQDPRRDVNLATEEAMIHRFDPSNTFRAEYAVLGAQRSLRILGVFSRLVALGKPAYLPLIPRVWGHLRRNMAHPALAELAAVLDLPAPSADILDRIAQCRP